MTERTSKQSEMESGEVNIPSKKNSSRFRIASDLESGEIPYGNLKSTWRPS